MSSLTEFFRKLRKERLSILDLSKKRTKPPLSETIEIALNNIRLVLNE